jgi:hypothetical protein
MSDLDDFNRRMTLGDAAGPPRSLGDVAAQMQIDARQPGGQPPPGGGGIDIPTRKAGVLLAVGLLLMAAGAYLVLAGGAAVAGAITFVVGAAMALFFGLGVLAVGLHRIGFWRIAAACVAGGLAWAVVSPWLASRGLPLPGWLAGLATGALVFAAWRRRR